MDAAVFDWLREIMLAKYRTAGLYAGLPSYPSYFTMVEAGLSSFETAAHEQQEVQEEPGL